MRRTRPYNARNLLTRNSALTSILVSYHLTGRVMKTLFLFLCLTTISFPQHFSELRGLEDQSNITHLFYRIYSETGDFSNENNIYHLNTVSNSDTLFLKEYRNESSSVIINDYDFWNNDPRQFIYSVTEMSTDTITNIINYSGDVLFTYNGSGGNIELSRQDKNIIVVNTSSVAYRTVDGGLIWEAVSFGNIGSVSPFNDNILFSVRNDSLYKSVNGGVDFYLVKPNADRDLTNNYFYDMDGIHIYRMSKYDNGSSIPDLDAFSFFISDNKGDPFSWIFKEPPIWHYNIYLMTAAVDESVSGKVYLSQGSTLFLSTDYGSGFSVFNTLPAGMVNIYAKPGSDKVYAATSRNIYEVTSGNYKSIKNIELSSALRYYPLRKGLKWIYHDFVILTDPGWHTDEYDFSREVIGDTLIDGLHHFIIETNKQGYVHLSCQRIDSVTGIVSGDYMFSRNQNDIINLSLIKGEDYNSIWGTTFFSGNSIFDKWSIIKPYKKHELLSLFYSNYNLIKDIGIDSLLYSFDFGWGRITLKGMVIDGIVYGDTTFVDVNDIIPVPQTFSLSQNYPNPFNPSTRIRIYVPHREFVTIKLYDILGNEAAILLNEERDQGIHEILFTADRLSSGVYFYKMTAGNISLSNKMILIK
jgi:hypothetical protein